MNHSNNVSLATVSLLTLFACSVCGCGSDNPTVVPASGVVLFEGKPLESGSIMFQPETGQHARGYIQPDGTFEMTTFNEGDGATPGRQSVRVTSTEKQTVDSSGEEMVGRSLIPRAYGNFRASGITVDIPPEGTDSIVIELEKNKK